MKITELQVDRVVVPVKRPRAKSDCIESEPFERLYHRYTHILRIHTDEGLVGIGSSHPSVRDKYSRPEQIIGTDPMSYDPKRLPEQGVGDSWDVAMLDLIGKIIGKPVWWLFGGKYQDRILVDCWMGLTTPEDSAQIARQAAEEGFHGLKMKVPEEEDTLKRVEAIAAVAPSLKLVLDCMHGFRDIDRMKTLLRQLESFNVLMEDPLPKGDWEGYRRLQDCTDIPLCPHLSSAEQVIEGIKAECMDGYNVGPYGYSFMHLAALGHAVGLPVWHGSNVDLGIRDMFYVHGAAATPNCTLGSDICGNFTNEDDIIAEPLEIVDGFIIVPDKPGLGVEVDEEAIRRYRG
jgi:muconate cycloisomerase